LALEDAPEITDHVGMFEFFLGYSAGSATATRAATLARSAAAADGLRNSNRVEDVNERVDQLMIVVRAMWSLMEKQGLTPQDLEAEIDHLDKLDGVADGAIRSGPVACTSCDSMVAPGLKACQFCGAAVTTGDHHPLSGV